MSPLAYREIGDDVIRAMDFPRKSYFGVMGVMALGVAVFFCIWTYQVLTGMGVAGINHPVGWGVYIANFVFWVGIAHSGTLISAILHLVRARWRAAVSRAAEAMTVFAVMTAGLFPLIHLGRFWVFYFIIPYPSERQLWPNFTSPLVWDVVAVTTYLTVSAIFFYVGMLPDLAAARDRESERLGESHPRTRLYRRLALGWHGQASQWRHFGRSYLFFAALATPLVVSVHSVVSWDFAMGILPGWHTTIFAPYFVAGAIHSGLAMVLTLLIPMRRLLKLQRLITVDHLQFVARTMIVTTLIVGYAYIIEPFMAWYSGDRFEAQFAWWRATGWLAWAYWALIPLNVLIPLLFLFRKVRTSLPALFVISILVNVGMWLERFTIVVGSTSHDFMPHNWGPYAPTWVEISITAGSFVFFLFWFLGFSKLLPTVPASELKELLAEEDLHGRGESADPPPQAKSTPTRDSKSVLAVFDSPSKLTDAVVAARQADMQVIDAFSPVRLDSLTRMLHPRPSPTRLWTLMGVLSGIAGGFALAIGSALVNSLVVGGKPVIAIVPFCIIGFEGGVLLGTLANLAGLILSARLARKTIPAGYDKRFSRDKFGLLVGCRPEEIPSVQSRLKNCGAEEIHDLA